jgi:ribosomal protein L37AE/L43A
MAKNTCTICGVEFAERRAALGYKTCLPCGEGAAKAVKHCVVPISKSNYVVVTKTAELLGLNPKTDRSA